MDGHLVSATGSNLGEGAPAQLFESHEGLPASAALLGVGADPGGLRLG